MIKNFHCIIRIGFKVDMFNAGYSQISVIVPYLVVAPVYFSTRMPFGQLMQIGNAFGKGPGFAIVLHRRLPEYRGVACGYPALTQFAEAVDGLDERVAALTQARRESVRHSPPRAIWRSTDRMAWAIARLDLSLDQRDSLLITGTTGAGKSTLLRTLAGAPCAARVSA